MLAVFLLPGAVPAATFTNPIIPGGHPDPSICYDGEAWYVVNSTFEYFPGLPIHRSTDLVNWELIGHGLHRIEQASGAVNLVDVQSDGGIHAPTIRCRDGKFYIITTNVYLSPAEGAETEFVNFVITADDPAGPWSKPYVLDGAPGIDPDIFFDDDGRVWYVGTHSPEEPNFPGEGEIWLQEIDANNWSLIGERYFLWRGACGGVWAEGPHMYKHDGRYYLLVAEGGTSFNHAVTIAVSDDITGPYVSNDRNPILTSRHLSYDNWVTSTGHADLFQLPDGRWYTVLLGVRGDFERATNMGRETHLVPATWEREPFEWKVPRYEWPVIAPESGRVERHLPLPFADHPQQSTALYVDEFDDASLGLEWNFRRVPLPDSYSLTARPGYLRLSARPEVIRERGRASLTGFRQTESDFRYEAHMQFTPQSESTEAGMLLFQKDDNYISILLSRQGDTHSLKVVMKSRNQEAVVVREAALDAYAGEILLRVVSADDRYVLSYSLDKGKTFADLATLPANLILSRGYTGAYLGLYATGNGTDSEDYADFDRVSYQPSPRD